MVGSFRCSMASTLDASCTKINCFLYHPNSESWVATKQPLSDARFRGDFCTRFAAPLPRSPSQPTGKNVIRKGFFLLFNCEDSIYFEINENAYWVSIAAIGRYGKHWNFHTFPIDFIQWFQYFSYLLVKTWKSAEIIGNESFSDRLYSMISIF